jgi:hypothetical protein
MHFSNQSRRPEIAAYREDHPEVARRVAVYSARRALLQSAPASVGGETPVVPADLSVWRDATKLP